MYPFIYCVIKLCNIHCIIFNSGQIKIAVNVTNYVFNIDTYFWTYIILLVSFKKYSMWLRIYMNKKLTYKLFTNIPWLLWILSLIGLFIFFKSFVARVHFTQKCTKLKKSVAGLSKGFRNCERRSAEDAHVHVVCFEEGFIFFFYLHNQH